MKKIVHKKYYSLTGWLVLCGNKNWEFATMKDDLVTCEDCLEVMFKFKGLTYEEWEEHCIKAGREVQKDMEKE